MNGRKPQVYTLGTAAKATGKSKATISKAIKTGRISAAKRDDGVFDIDPSELHRVYPFVSRDAPNNETFNGLEKDSCILEKK